MFDFAKTSPEDRAQQCLACRLNRGVETPPGGRLYRTPLWGMEHCIGPLGVGTVALKPLRHCEHMWDLSPDESRELGPLLRIASAIVRGLLEPDQIYVCQWSHAGFEPQHLHFLVQPAYRKWRKQHDLPGPFVQTAMLRGNRAPNHEEVERFCDKFREALATLGFLPAAETPPDSGSAAGSGKGTTGLA